jgi:L-alanine-DL-glutamate epimerase-like enolase superfamily enzyme
VGRRGLVTQAQAAVDMALWDIKGKIAGQPVYKLLGGRRESAPCYGSDGGWLYMSVAEMLKAFEEYLAQGMMGVKMKIGHEDPRKDIQRVREVRKVLGDDVWIAVDANQKWDFPTAMRVGRELEQLGVAWFEEPLLCEDIPGHARLAAALDIPVAMGETLGSRFEFDAYIRAGAADILQPDIVRVGGITEMVKIATLADVAGLPVAPHHMMETTIQVACGVMASAPIEYMPWVAAAFSEPVVIKDGQMLPPRKPGLGLEIPEATIKRYREE